MKKIIGTQAPIHRISWQNLSLFIIGFGIILRLAQYLANRSLWSDEASLTLNIINRSYLELFQPLDYDQAAPVGFLVLEKFLVQLLGNNEYVLRSLPLICGILSLFLLYFIAKKYFQPLAVVIAVTMLAASSHSIYYSSEVKQYSSDITIALLCFAIAQQLGLQNLKKNKLFLAILSGSILIWFSHPAVFVLSGVGLSSILGNLIEKKPVDIKKVLLIGLSWCLSFLLFYWFSIKNLTGHQNLMTSWSEKASFPTSILDFNWLVNKAFLAFLDKPLDFEKTSVYFAAIAFLIGCFSLLRRNPKILALTLAPILMTLAASYLQKYPFHGRLVLFLTPFFMLLIAEGLAFALQKIWSLFDRKEISSKILLKVVLSAAFIIPILFHPLADALPVLVEPKIRDQIKPVISYIKTRQQLGDVLYIFQRGANQFVYYAPKYGYKETDYKIGIDDLDIEEGKPLSLKEKERYQADLDTLKGNRRVWIVFCHFNREENSMVLSHLDGMGEQLDAYQNKGSSVYLYNLSQ